MSISLPTIDGQNVNAAQHNLLALLRLRLTSMTLVLKQVGEYLLNNPDEVVYLSINEVAEGAKVSVASVMRLCKELNYNSFAGFKLALASELAVQENDRRTNGVDSYAGQLSDDLSEVMRMTAQIVDDNALREVAHSIINAKRVILFGIGASFVPAAFFSYKLTRLGIHHFLSTDSHMTSMAVNVGGSDELLLLFSNSGSVRDTIELAELANKRSISTIAFTNRVKCPLGECCDKQIVAMGSESPLTSGSLHSKCGQLLMLELLFDAICRISEVHSQRIQDAADAVSEKQY